MAASAAFEILQTQRAGWARLSVTGELDLLTAEIFRCRLRALRAANTNVLVDLSRVDFIDAAGIHARDVALADGRRGRWRVELEPNMSHQLRRVFGLINAAGVRTEL
jgi:hypothetical protein